MEGSSYEQKFNRTSKLLLWLAATFLPVAGAIGILGIFFFHSLLTLWIVGGAYLAAFIILGVKGAWEYRRWSQSGKSNP
ncbi:MAG: hypothetical protein ABI383_13485 [Acidobacteriaceae bacterium]